jgi:hypothetical protein
MPVSPFTEISQVKMIYSFYPAEKCVTGLILPCYKSLSNKYTKIRQD